MRRSVVGIEPAAHEHLFAVQRPAFDHDVVRMLTADFILETVRDRELKKVAGDALVTENRPRVFNGRANVEVPALRIVCGNEIKAGWILVVNSGRVHETARTGWFEGFGKLANFKSAERRQSDEMIVFQKGDHLGFAA